MLKYFVFNNLKKGIKVLRFTKYEQSSQASYWRYIKGQILIPLNHKLKNANMKRQSRGVCTFKEKHKGDQSYDLTFSYVPVGELRTTYLGGVGKVSNKETLRARAKKLLFVPQQRLLKNDLAVTQISKYTHEMEGKK